MYLIFFYSCNYDVLDLQNLDEILIFDERRDSSTTPWRRCGNWNSRLKLLQWRSNENQARIMYVETFSTVRLLDA